MTRMALRIADSSNRLDTEFHESEGRSTTLELGQIVSVLRRRRWVFLIWVLVGLAAGIAYLATTPKSYQAQATVLLTGQTNTNIDEVSVVEGESVAEITIENALQVLSSQRLAISVVDRLNLTQDERLLAERPSGLAILVGGIKDAFRSVLNVARRPAPEGAATDQTGYRELSEEELRREAIAQDLQKRVRISRVGRSSAIAIWFEMQSPDLASDLANAYVQAYTDDILQSNQAVNEQAANWLSQRLAQLGAEAKDALIAVERFRTENGIVESREGLMTEESVRRLNDEYSVALAEEARSRALVAAYETVLAIGPDALDNRSVGVLLPTGTTDNERVSELQQQFDALITRRDDVVETFGPDHPEAVRLQTAVADMADRLFAEITLAAAAARGDLDVANGRVQALSETLGGAVETNAAAGEALVELRALEQRAEAMSTLYETLLVQAERANQQRTLPVSSVRVLSLATIPHRPSSPSTTRTLGFLIVLGLLTATLHSALREWKDRFVRTASDITDKLGQRFLGYLPTLPELHAVAGAARHAELPLTDAKGKLKVPRPPAVLRHSLPVLQEPRSFFAETLRSIRLASDLAWPGEGGRIIGVTSIRPGEGKTTTAANLAAVLASGGQQVLLVDADLRKADLSHRLDLTGQSGLMSLTLADIAVDGAISRIADTGLSVIGCEGRVPGSIAYDVLSSPKLHSTLTDARSAFRFIVLDLAPLGPVVDARLLFNLVDQVVLVAEWGRTPRQLLSYTLANDPQLHGKLLGVVLSRVNVGDLSRYAAPDLQPEYGSYFDADPALGRR